MKGIIFDIKRFAVHDGPGIRVTAFMKGCPLSCRWCHNPEGIDPDVRHAAKKMRIGDKTFTEDERVGYEILPETLVEEFRKEKIFMEESGGGVTFSGGEPLMQPGFLRETLALCKRERFHTAVDTSGFSAWDNFDAIRNLTDLFLYDLKIVDNDLHRAYTGVSNAIIHENLSRLLAAGHRVRIRIPVVPNATFTPENISRSIALLKSMPAAADGVDLLPFHNTAAHKYARFNIRNGFEDVRSVPKNELSEIKQQFEAAGFDVRTGG